MKSKTKPDIDQLRAINIDTNAVVSAGAGSGKTTVLANRYLRLICEGKAGVENILTLTFTRKAAQEMHERIYSLLIENKDDARVGAQLALFENSQISTLDSFCSQIARNWIQRFGVSPDFRIDEKAAKAETEQIALDFILEMSGDPVLQEFIFGNGFERVWKEFFVSLAQTKFTVGRELDFEGMSAAQSIFLRDELKRAALEAENYAARFERFDPSAGAGIKNAVAAVSLLSGVSGMVEAGETEELRLHLEGFSIRKPGKGKHADYDAVRELIEPVRKTVGSLMEILITLQSKNLIDGMLEICTEFQRRVIEGRRNSGTLFFHDVVEMARVCLIENHDLRSYYKHRFTHIMIDEFQDNNRLQKELLYLLAEKSDMSLDRIPEPHELEPEKLFFVGDEKQSIYMFRGADVSVFKELSDEAEQSGGEALSLPKNYRSEPLLIDFFNDLFSIIMADSQHPFEARFEKLKARAPELSKPPHIVILYKPYHDKKDVGLVENDDAEAITIARFVKESVEKKLPVFADGEERPARFEDFALLMRSTSNQSKYETAFRILGVPHRTQTIRSLFLEAPLNDMYNLLQLAVYPEDRTAYAGFLRSPIVNVSDETLVRLLFIEKSSFEYLDEDIAAVSDQDREKLDIARRLFEHVRTNADRVPIARLVFNIWYRYGYRYLLLKDQNLHPYLEYFDYFRELARQADLSFLSLAGFLDIIRPHLGKFERLPDLDILKDESDGSGGVQILTIHKAKGLEFPVVILANTGNRGRSGESGAPYYFSEEHGITLNIAQFGGGKKTRTNYFYSRGKEEQAAKDEAELKRLLYVGVTRAKQHLVISGCHNKNNQNKNNNQKNESVLLNMVLRSLGWEPGTDVLQNTAISPFLTEIPDVPREFLQSGNSGKKHKVDVSVA
ncbi:MAG: UvrD-helicase domain-containing protein, partial [Spirochaetales bacterium]|nr:UvrD-helicase domain-containing protein [Spirochaetales bacterium]